MAEPAEEGEPIGDRTPVNGYVCKYHLGPYRATGHPRGGLYFMGCIRVEMLRRMNRALGNETALDAVGVERDMPLAERFLRRSHLCVCCSLTVRELDLIWIGFQPMLVKHG